jgi:imidazolonepropionase-like amidohydrolase
VSRLFLLAALACRAPIDPRPEAPEPPAAATVLRGATVVGLGITDLTITDGWIVGVGPSDDAGVDLAGRFLVPAVIDAHVHIVYAPRGPELVRGGVAGAVDWAAPLTGIGPIDRGPDVVWAGPILTAPRGYPTQSWGAGGYGLEIASVDEAEAAVASIHASGARVAKIAIGAGGPDLDDARLRAIVDAAHARGMLVGAHALTDAAARRAADLGADLLVHAPSATLSDATVAAWADRAVIPTLSAFGGADATRRLRAAGARVLYGTDFGNTGALGVSLPELQAMAAAGLSPAQILASATSEPAALFGFDRLGAIAVGKDASLLVLDDDPLLDPTALARPRAVLHRGRLVAGEL